MLQLSGLTNKRESKESYEVTPRVRALNFSGGIRLNNAAAEALGINLDNLYVAPANAGEQVYLGLGKAHTPKLDEKGNEVKHSTGRIETENDGYGSKAKVSTHAKPHYTINASAVQTLLRTHAQDDNFEGNVVFTLGEPTEATIDTGNENYPSHTTLMYPLVFEKLEAKEEKEADDEDAEVEATEVDLSQQASSEVSEDAGVEADKEDTDEDW